MPRRSLVCAVTLLFAVTLTLLGQDQLASSGSWSGVIINSTCSVDEAFAESAKCTAAGVPGAKLVLYDDTIRQIYNLDPPATAGLADAVIVHGALDGNTIRGASIKALTSFGLDVGQKAPPFLARDQFGRVQTLETLKGSKGTVLLFYRSADWCPYCKGQLIQLQAVKERFEKQGIKLVGISYDSVEILKYFSDRRKIDFPLLSDPDSKIIRRYQVLNSEAVGPNAGMARPGYFFIDPNGVIREKFFEAKYRERLTGNSVISKLFPELSQEVTETVAAPHLQLALEQSDPIAYPGTRVTLVAEVRLPPDVHVYAPGTQGYKPIQLVIEPVAQLEFKPAVYPPSKILYLPAIKEKVPVFDGTFRISQDVKVNSGSEFWGSLGKDGKLFTITGKLDYQACDKTICFLPTSVPVKWELHVFPLDRTRVPVNIRHK